MRIRYFISMVTLVAVTLLLAGTLPGLTQQPAQPGQARQGGGMRGAFTDPDKIFDMYSNGKDVIVISDAVMLQSALTKFAAEQGISGNTITRPQFAVFMQQTMGKLISGDPEGKAFIGDMMKQMADLNRESQADPNSERAKKWAEFKAKMADPEVQAAMAKAREMLTKAMQPKIVEDIDPGLDIEALNKRPDVYRIGKMPKGLPAWFAELDKDRDGQVGLYEWRLSDKSIQQFQSMDRNGDGLLTAEELLYFMNNMANIGKAKGSIASFKDDEFQPPVLTQSQAKTWNPGGQFPSTKTGGQNAFMNGKSGQFQAPGKNAWAPGGQPFDRNAVAPGGQPFDRNAWKDKWGKGG